MRLSIGDNVETAFFCLEINGCCTLSKVFRGQNYNYNYISRSGESIPDKRSKIESWCLALRGRPRNESQSQVTIGTAGLRWPNLSLSGPNRASPWYSLGDPYPSNHQDQWTFFRTIATVVHASQQKREVVVVDQVVGILSGCWQSIPRSLASILISRRGG